jgi:hypothetical protein
MKLIYLISFIGLAILTSCLTDKKKEILRSDKSFSSYCEYKELLDATVVDTFRFEEGGSLYSFKVLDGKKEGTVLGFDDDFNVNYRGTSINDTFVLLAKFYENNKLKEEQSLFYYSFVKTTIASEIKLYKEGILIDTMGEYLTFNYIDTIQWDLENELIFNFESFRCNESFQTELNNKITIEGAHYYDFFGKNHTSLLSNYTVENNTFTLTPKGYGYVNIYLDLRNEKGVSRVIKRTFFIVPKDDCDCSLLNG